jgi:hypothetical protein
MLNDLYPKMEYAPLVIRITSLTLMFCTRVETFEIMKNFIKMNMNEMDIIGLRWHTRFDYASNNKVYSSMTDSFRELCGVNLKDLLLHFDSIGFNLNKLHKDMVESLFLEYFNFNIVQKIFTLYMNEGIKILYRVAAAVLNIFKPYFTKISHPDDVIAEVKRLCRQLKDHTELFLFALDYKLTRTNNKYENQIADTNSFVETKLYHLPKLTKQSQLINNDTIIKLWSMMPNKFRAKDADLAFTTELNGFSIKGIYNLIEKQHRDPLSYMLFLIQTHEGEIFGGLTSQLFRHTNLKWVRPLETYIVSIKPELKIYPEQKYTDYILNCDNENISFINGQVGPCIKFDANLSAGVTYFNEYYRSPSLVGKNEFEIKTLEIFILN